MTIVMLLPASACARDSDAGAPRAQPAHDCSNQVRHGGRIYTGYGYTDRVATRLGPADRAECHDMGDDPRGSFFPEHPPTVLVWSFEGFPADQVLGVRFDDDSFEVLVEESVPAATRDCLLTVLGRRTR